jgi:hypothetical protein
MIDPVGFERDLQCVDLIEQRKLEMEAWPKRLIHHDLAEPPLAGHLGRLDDDIRARREDQQDANPDKHDGQPSHSGAAKADLRQLVGKGHRGDRRQSEMPPVRALLAKVWLKAG